MFAFYNPTTNEYAHVEAEIGYEEHCYDQAEVMYSFVTIGGTLYTHQHRSTLENILRICDLTITDHSINYGDLDTPCDIKLLKGFKIVEIGHIEPKYRIKTEVSTGYEITYRDFDGTVEQCIEYMDKEVSVVARNGLLKGIQLEVDGMIHRDTLYDVTKFLMNKKFEV